MKEHDHEGIPPKFLTRAALATVAALLLTAQAHAQQPRACAPRTILVERLAEKYGEAPVSIGITKAGSVLEVFASESGAWTIFVSLPNGMSCIVGTGRGWENIPVPEKIKGVAS